MAETYSLKNSSDISSRLRLALITMSTHIPGRISGSGLAMWLDKIMTDGARTLRNGSRKEREIADAQQKDGRTILKPVDRYFGEEKRKTEIIGNIWRQPLSNNGLDRQ